MEWCQSESELKTYRIGSFRYDSGSNFALEADLRCCRAWSNLLNCVLFPMVFSLSDDEASEAELSDSSWERLLPACNVLLEGDDCCEIPGFAKGEPVGKLWVAIVAATPADYEESGECFFEVCKRLCMMDSECWRLEVGGHPYLGTVQCRFAEPRPNFHAKTSLPQPPNRTTRHLAPSRSPLPTHPHPYIVTFNLALRIADCYAVSLFCLQHCIAASPLTSAALANFPFTTRRHDSLHPNRPPRWLVVPLHRCNIPPNPR